MSATAFQTYYSQMESVDGWLQPTTAIMSYALLRHQVREGIAGNVCEIGVHHGKYFIALCTALLGNERGIGIDLFEQAQDENIDNSGHGNRHVFDQQVAKFLNPHQVVVIQGNSTRMTADQITAHGAVRFFSVDGGHTEGITESDLRLAEQSIGGAGVVAVDDIQSYYWTGVVGGVVRYKAKGGSLVGFALIPGKLLMCAPQHADSYRAFMRAEFVGGLARPGAEFLGDQVDIYYAMTDEQLAGWARPAVPPSTVEAENAALRQEIARLQASRRYRWASRVADAVNRLTGRG